MSPDAARPLRTADDRPTRDAPSAADGGTARPAPTAAEAAVVPTAAPPLAPTVAPPLARFGGAARALALLVGVVAGVTALRVGRPVLLPLVAGGFLAVLARPLQVAVRARLPRPLRWVGLVVALLAIVAGLGAFGGALAIAGRAVAGELRDRRPTIEAQAERLRSRADRLGLPVPAGLPSGGGAGQQGATGEGGSSAGARPSGATASSGSTGGGGAAGALGGVLRTAGAGIAGLLLSLAIAALALTEADELRRRVAHLQRAPSNASTSASAGASAGASTGTSGAGPRLLAAFDEAAPLFRRYVWVKTLTSALTGVATGLLTLAFGLPLAWVWGFLAFLLEYVPSVGSLVAIVPPTLMALAEGGPGRAAGVFLAVGTLQLVLGNVVDPRLEGRLMAISPLGVLLSIVFWGWLWGAPGALLGVPLTVALVVLSRHLPGAHGVATLVAGDGVDASK